MRILFAVLFNFAYRTYSESLEGVGTLIGARLRMPFRAFTRNSLMVMFTPELSGAMWYVIDTKKVDYHTLSECGNPYKAMAYLRSVQPERMLMP